MMLVHMCPCLVPTECWLTRSYRGESRTEKEPSRQGLSPRGLGC